MDNTEFLSGGVNLVLPTKNNPKVYLNIENGRSAREAFKLYNPFSKKARLLKTFTKFLSIYFNFFAKIILPTVRSEKSKFIQELERRLDKEIKSSVYLSTAHDKVVLQLLENGSILGYLKYAISPLGHKRILNEKKATKMLFELDLIPELIDEGSYDKRPYIILQNVEGSIGNLEPSQYQVVLDLFKKQNSFKLVDHPRIHKLRSQLEFLELWELCEILDQAINHSTNQYYEVFEHGDFAPWNLIWVANELMPFDFEYFEEHGLEHLDALKFQFQVNHLLHNKRDKKLLESIRNEVGIPEFNSIFSVFLIKEILMKVEVDEPYGMEMSLLNLLSYKNISTIE
ncbi:hypothetical protein FEE95_01890 [Maribacter algarum]|uniref:Aminoglycoside phosphotransferase domain-containing protein n=1 Tax=Maribacter algarum (ex Zhang et al. 2020) TaxID=2578118 RepID=A0A5S3PVI0_9FLAO|nr:hypothetical protein [Maribacter algarum]TMM58202.1 hypothetical protein FEE95_01890 [Maribacter algarum]